MIAIKDMKMPKNCGDCELKALHPWVPGYFCKVFTGANYIMNKEIRQKFCPLVEVEVK